MLYEVVLGPASGEPRRTAARTLKVEVIELPSGELRAQVDGRAVELDVVEVGGALSVRVDGRVVDLITEGELPELGMVVSGHRSYAQVTSDRLRAALAAKRQGGGAGDKIIKSPMPGRIVKVLVQEGDQVEPGQGLVIVEAMKMENELKAKAAATVAAVHVKALDTVEGNAKLITLA